ncbi:dynein regulatory complex subunit 4-like isoform X1 [Seriola aureovittata]|uniref:dynein regulatory complex subunit 4-like isoform X1 n=3 Tax=Seriola aureovittata TaxID=2871759 RepID=UPI0024BE0F60|nr:dynein regulatory complex subunit 4-like isoform X1 [Seriola aureovittata]
MMPSKTKDKKKKQKKDSQPKEEMPTAQVTETEGETKELVEKSPAVVDRHSMAEKTIDEMWEEYGTLLEEFEGVQKEKKHLKIEIALKSSENTERKRNLEKTKAKMRERLKLKQDAEKCRCAEIEEHQQKLAQLGSAHHSEIHELKMAATAMTSKTHKEHVRSELELHMKINLLQAEKREKETLTELYMKKLKQNQLAELREQNQSNDKEVREMEVRYMNKTKIMLEENMKKTKGEVEEIEKSMKIFTASIIEKHDRSSKELCDLIKNLNDLERGTLERTLKKVTETVAWQDRSIAATKRKNKHMTESLLEMGQKFSESRQELNVQRKAMAKRIQRSNKVTAHILKERRDLYLKNQQLELKYEQAQQEREELQRKQAEALLDVQQKSDLKVLVLERQIKSLTENLEKEQFKLWVALAFGLGDQTAAKNIKELFDSKHATIKALKDDISGDLMEYDKAAKKATALETSVDKWLSSGDMEKSIRKTSEDSKDSVDLIRGLLALCISEDKSVQRNALGLNPAGAGSTQ